MDGVEIVLVGVGAALGGILRFVVTYYGKLHPSEAFNIPYWTLVVNVFGGLVFGLVFALSSDSKVRAALTTGFCGGLTTFSSFSNETYDLLKAGGTSAGWGILNVVLNVVLSIVSCWIGRAIGEA